MMVFFFSSKETYEMGNVFFPEVIWEGERDGGGVCLMGRLKKKIGEESVLVISGL